jgi:hypothetical protein
LFVCGLWFGTFGVLRFRIRDLVFVIHGTTSKSPVNSLIHSFVSEPSKTRGAIGFALIFLCFVSLYQDKEMNKNHLAPVFRRITGDFTVLQDFVLI